MFSLDDLKAIVHEGKVQNIDQLLPLLPEELRSNFNLVYQSESPEKESVSTTTPRVLLRSRDGKFILSFTGKTEGSSKVQDDYNKLPIIEFANGDFVFHEVQIAEGKVIDRVNPPECMQCHVNKTPIWNSYSVWPFSYGSFDDSFQDRRAAKELQDFLQFKESVKGTRYQHLILDDPSIDVEIQKLQEQLNKIGRSNQTTQQEKPKTLNFL